MYQRQVGFGEAISRAFSNYCNFSGRASRSEYWWFVLFQIIVIFPFNVWNTIANSPLTGSQNFVPTIIVCILGLFFLLPSLGLCVRRLHDIGKSGWWYLIGLIPLVGAILLIVWYCQDSQRGPNRWGDEPNMVY